MNRINLGRLLTVAAGIAGAAGLALVATQASAATGPAVYASCATNDGNACAGQVASMASGFGSVTATAFNANPDQFAPITDGVGWQVGLKTTSGTDAIIGISDSAPSNGAGYSPQSLVYSGGSITAVAPNALWCAHGQPCAPASQGGAFPVGNKVTLSVAYNPGEGTVNFDAWDNQGNFYKAFYVVGGGVTFEQARIEAGYDPGHFTAPASRTTLVGISGVKFAGATGSRLNLRSASVTDSPEFGTSDGTSTGTVQAAPGTVNAKGTAFSVVFPAG